MTDCKSKRPLSPQKDASCPFVFVKGVRCVAATDLSHDVMDAYWRLVPYHIPARSPGQKQRKLNWQDLEEDAQKDYWRSPQSFAFILLASKKGFIRMIELANCNWASGEAGYYMPEWGDHSFFHRGQWQHSDELGAPYADKALGRYKRQLHSRKTVLFALPRKLHAYSASMWLVWPEQPSTCLNFEGAWDGEAPLQTLLFDCLNEQLAQQGPEAGPEAASEASSEMKTAATGMARAM